MPTTSFTAANESQLNSAIQQIDVGGANSATNTAYTITLTSGFTLTSELLAINLASGSSLTIVGGSETINGGGNQRGFFVYSGTVAIDDLTIADTLAKGGAGAGGSDGGGGGAGLGGALFVAGSGDPTQAVTPVVTLDDVTFSGNTVVGGTGGNSHVSGPGSGAGGGLGGAGGGSNGGGGGIGITASGGDGANGGVGIVPGAGSGGSANGSGGASGGGGGAGGGGVRNFTGGGGGGVDGGSGGIGGTGGVGGVGGGGGSGLHTAGGHGGFGGGGGGARSGGFGGGGGGLNGAGGFGAGSGSTKGGGGGLGAGGDIFVQQGGTLIIDGAGGLTGGSATGGAGADAVDDGEGLGSGIFLQGSGSLTFAPAGAQTESIGDVITDQTGSGGTGNNAGAWGLVLDGSGTLVLTAANSYSGGTTISAGSLQLGNGGTSGSIAGTITDNAVLAVDQSGTDAFGNVVAGDGVFKQLGTGTTALSEDQAYTGGTVVAAGTLQLGSGVHLADGGNLEVDGGTFNLNGSNQTIGDLSGAGGTVALATAVLTVGTSDSTSFAGAISGTGLLVKTGSGTLTLTGADDPADGVVIQLGTLQLGTGGAAGSLASAVFDDATFAIDRSGTITLSGAISGNGSLDQLGSGTTILTAADTYTGGTTIGAGTLQLGNGGTDGSISGDVIDNAVLADDNSASDTLAGMISGVGAFQHTGSGTTVLIAADSYAGGTTISAGTLQLGDGSSNGSIVGNVVDDAVLADDDSGTNSLAGIIAGTGAFHQIGSGTTILTAADTYGGGTTVSAGTLELGAGGSLDGNVIFAGGGALLQFATGINQLSGQILGTAATDGIDAAFVAFAAGEHAVWQQTSTSGGTLSLYNNGADLASFSLAGQFNSLDFTVGNDGSGGALITVRNTPNYADTPGTNDEWILSDGNLVESGAPGSHPAGYDIAGVGDWTGNGTDGILWYNASTGDTDEWQLSNTQWSASVDLGPHPANGTDGASYQIAGIGDFAGNGISDVLWTSTNSNGSVATDIWELGANGGWSSSVSPGTHPAGYTVVGVGDWTGNGTDGVLWYDAATGDTDEWQLDNGQWSASVDLGSHPGRGWSIAGIGDFFDNGRDDVLWTNASGGSVQTDIWQLGANGQWIASVSPGSHPAGYQVVGIGDFTGTGTSDILWQNTATGDVDEWLINNGQWAGSVDLGTHSGNFQIAGIGDFAGTGTSDILWHSGS